MTDTNTNKRHSLNKTEKVYLKEEIKSLFKGSYSFMVNDIRTLVKSEENSKNPSYKILFVASKRNYKNAVTRNKIKRLLREAYRLNKQTLYKPNKNILLAFMFTGDSQVSFQEIEQKIILTLQKINNYLINKNLTNENENISE